MKTQHAVSQSLIIVVLVYEELSFIVDKDKAYIAHDTLGPYEIMINMLHTH